MYQNPARSGRMPLVSSRTCLPLEAHRSPRHSPARRATTCIISFYIMAGHCRSDFTATFDTILDKVLRGASPPGYTARWPQVRPLALALALPFARPRTSLAACGAHVARCVRPPMPKTPQDLSPLPPCAYPRRRSAGLDTLSIEYTYSGCQYILTAYT